MNKDAHTFERWTRLDVRPAGCLSGRDKTGWRNLPLDTYPHQIEVITSEQMMDAYSSVGMPINYPHWSFGKKFIETERLYKHGQQGLAYEIVINS
ncbi:SpoVR family protein [Escherichia coli]